MTMALFCFGATVAGPAHLREGRPNQDAWSHTAVAAGHVVVVADGMGSRPLADIGAKAACAAVPEALRTWARHGSTDTSLLLGLVHLLWRARLGDHDPAQAATTCLFAFMRNDGSGIAAQLGDGLILLCDDAGVRPLRTRRDDAFANTTEALGVTNAISAWTTVTLDPATRGVLLCTDGVSDDLLPERHHDFATWVEGEIGSQHPATRWRRLARELREWPTPHHIDDKSVAWLGRQA